MLSVPLWRRWYRYPYPHGGKSAYQILNIFTMFLMSTLWINTGDTSQLSDGRTWGRAYSWQTCTNLRWNDANPCFGEPSGGHRHLSENMATLRRTAQALPLKSGCSSTPTRGTLQKEPNSNTVSTSSQEATHSALQKRAWSSVANSWKGTKISCYCLYWCYLMIFLL